MPTAHSTVSSLTDPSSMGDVDDLSDLTILDCMDGELRALDRDLREYDEPTCDEGPTLRALDDRDDRMCMGSAAARRAHAETEPEVDVGDAHALLAAMHPDEVEADCPDLGCPYLGGSYIEL